MRRLLALLLLLFAAAPAGASAVEVAVDTPEEPIPPLTGLATIPVRVSVECAHLDDEPRVVQLRIREAPPWAQATLSPSTLVPVASACEDGRWRGNATLIVSVTSDAPAFTPANVRVEANLSAVEPGAAAATLIEADYYALVDVVARQSAATGRPREPLIFPLDLTNHGNGVTRILLQTVGPGEGWQVVTPPPFTLESRQLGGRPNSTVALQAVYVGEVPATGIHRASSITGAPRTRCTRTRRPRPVRSSSPRPSTARSWTCRRRPSGSSWPSPRAAPWRRVVARVSGGGARARPRRGRGARARGPRTGRRTSASSCRRARPSPAVRSTRR